MKAARYYGREDLRIEDVENPGAPSPTQVLVKPRFCGICGTDIHEYYDGPIITPVEPHAFTGATLPQILGHEFSAEVIEVGKDVSHVGAGDLVSIQPLIMPMNDYYSRRGLHQASPEMATIGLQSTWGGFAEYAIVEDYNVFQLPESLDLQQGSIIEPAAVALSGADRSGVRGGSSAFIAGGGPIGALAALACKALGASNIVVSEPNPIRRNQIESLGVATKVIDPTQEDPEEIVSAVTEFGVGVDSAIECSGTGAGLDACARALRNFGSIALIGIHTRKSEFDPTYWAQKSLSINGVWGYPITSWPRILKMVETGTYPIGRIITDEIPFDSIIEQGFRRLGGPSSDQMKILVKI